MKLNDAETKLFNNISEICGFDFIEEQKLVFSSILSNCELYGAENFYKKLYYHLLNNNNIVIVGDYDADGIISTAFLYDFFDSIGVKKLDYFIPHRDNEGYGLTEVLLERVFSKYPKPGVIITVDNGIQSFSSVEKALLYGWDVLITDHHLPIDKLPNATAIVNPKCNDKDKKLELAGIGVIFILSLGFIKYLKNKKTILNDQIINHNIWLELVSIGTMADLVPLDPLNRLLVRQGFVRLMTKPNNYGVNEILNHLGFSSNKIPYKCLTINDLVFKLIPIINSTGRLNKAELAVNLLLSKNVQDAKFYLDKIISINKDRKNIQNKVYKEALECINSNNGCLIGDNHIILYKNKWPTGIIGIIASIFKDKYLKNIFVFSISGDNICKGSARGVDGISLKDLFNFIKQKYPGLLIQSGGHNLAAGLVINLDDINVFHLACNEYFSTNYIVDKNIETNIIELPAELISSKLLHLLDYWFLNNILYKKIIFTCCFYIIKIFTINRSSSDNLYMLNISSNKSNEHFFTGFYQKPITNIEVMDLVKINFYLSLNHKYNLDQAILNILDISKI